MRTLRELLVRVGLGSSESDFAARGIVRIEQAALLTDTDLEFLKPLQRRKFRAAAAEATASNGAETAAGAESGEAVTRVLGEDWVGLARATVIGGPLALTENYEVCFSHPPGLIMSQAHFLFRPSPVPHRHQSAYPLGLIMSQAHSLFRPPPAPHRHQPAYPLLPSAPGRIRSPPPERGPRHGVAPPLRFEQHQLP